MSKRFKGKPCAYCPGGVSETGDHVFARKFFPVRMRANLPQVPACDKCNNEKSALEAYLATILLFGGRHADALENLVASGERRLAKNSKLHRQLISGKERIWVPDQAGLLVPTMSVPIADDVFTRYFVFVIKGLLRYEFGETLGNDDFVDVQTITTDGGEPIYRRFLNLNAAARTTRDIGNGAFVYEGSRAADNGHVSIWLLTVFGGLAFQDVDGRHYEARIGAMTGPKRVADKVALRQKWAQGLGPLRQIGP